MSSHNLKNNLKKLLFERKECVDKLLWQHFGTTQEESKLSKALYYALNGSGKRFRPCITLIVAELLNNHLDVTHAALAIELFHTASLVADDLPIMDDDRERRGRPSLHQVYGEDVALLTSYALMGEGYRYVIENKNAVKGKVADADVRGDLAIAMLARNNGLQGAPSGQLLDLYPPKINSQTLDLIFYRKTVLFFETAFAFGWLFGGGDLNLLDLLKKGAYHFGMAFQVYDDFCDLKQDSQKGKLINYPLSLGQDAALCKLKSHIDQCGSILEKLNLKAEVFQEMLELMSTPLS